MLLIWTGFILLIIGLLALDLGVFHRKAHEIKLKESLFWSVVWIVVALAFSVFVYFGYENHWLGLGSAVDVVDKTVNDGTAAWVKYVTGYVVEKSLSVDNLFVIAMIFAFVGVPARYQHRVLFWGIVGAIVLRGIMIGVGAQLVTRFTWILYIFGGFLILTGIKMFMMRDDMHVDPSKNPVLRLAKRFFRITDQYHGQHLVVRAGSAAAHEGTFPEDKIAPVDPAAEATKKGALMLTPLALALILVETSDVVFAVDSIPAIFAITADPFLVFSSNIFAILGLRSLYFALAGMLDRFHYLKHALAFVLALVGVKMLTHHWLRQLLGEHFNFYLLGTVLGILVIGVVASLRSKKGRAEQKPFRTESTPEPAGNPQ